MAKRKLDSEESQFSGVASDLILDPDKPKYTPDERNVEQELFKRDAQKDKIDKFETQVLGIKKSDKPKTRVVYKTKMLTMTYEADRDFFNTLMNNKRFNLVKMDTTWTPVGEYLAFVIYTENLDYKDE